MIFSIFIICSPQQLYKHRKMISTYRSSKENSPMTKHTQLVPKIVEAQLKSNDLQYQHLLIEIKQVELELLHEEQKEKQFEKQYKNRKKPLDKAQRELQRAKNELHKKEEYLEEYYNYLDNRLKGTNTQNLQEKLQKLTISLEQRFQTEKQSIESSLDTDRETIQKLIQENSSLRIKIKLLREHAKQLTELENSHHTIQSISSNRKKTPEEMKEQYAHYERAIESLGKQYKQLQKHTKLVNRLINIQDQHKKYGGLISNGIKKQFIIKLKHQRYKSMAGEEFIKKLPELKSLLQQKKYEKEVLQQQLQQRKTELIRQKNTFNHHLDKYSHAEGEFIQESNRKSRQNI